MAKIAHRRTVAALLTACVCSITISFPAAHAADAKGSFALHGIGALTCADVIERTKTNPGMRDQLAAWLLGYVSATNRIRPNTYDITPIQQPLVLASMVSNVCAGNADSRVETVAHSVMTAIAPAGAKSESPVMKVESGKNFVELRKETLKAVQLALVNRKLLSGDATGEFGASTEKALIDFQTAQKLSVTGLPDPATLMRLLIEKSAL
jgi:hypothetical protein